MEKINLTEKLRNIQKELKAPKGQYNSFGKYAYRSCEDIFEAVKPLLDKNGLILRMTDSLEYIGDRYYIKATAILTDGDSFIENVGYAREEETKKGMDGSQITGASSSYARKYALNGLFLIDDVKDSDSTNKGDAELKDRTKLLASIKKLMSEKKVLPNEISEKFDKNSADMSDEELQEVIEWLGEK